MKKIMFNEQYGLQSAVLERRKTMTRRIVNYPKKFKGVEDTMLEFNRRIGADIYYDCVVCDADGHDLGQLPLPYEVGDVVAIAQSYESLVDNLYHGQEENFANCDLQEYCVSQDGTESLKNLCQLHAANDQQYYREVGVAKYSPKFGTVEVVDEHKEMQLELRELERAEEDEYSSAERERSRVKGQQKRLNEEH